VRPIMTKNRKRLLDRVRLQSIVWDELRRFKACQSINSVGVYLNDGAAAGAWRIGTLPNRGNLGIECEAIVKDTEERLGKQYDLGPED
jgi:hypothetical protein